MTIFINMIKNLFRRPGLNSSLPALRIMSGSRRLAFCALLAVVCVVGNITYSRADFMGTEYSEYYKSQGWEPVEASAEFTQAMNKYKGIRGKDSDGISDDLASKINIRYAQILIETASGAAAGGDTDGETAKIPYEKFVADIKTYHANKLISDEDAEFFLKDAEVAYRTALDRKKAFAAYKGEVDDVKDLQKKIKDIQKFNYCSDSCAPKCYYKELQTCSFCPLFKVIFNTASMIAQHAINTFSGSIIKVVIIAFGIWIAFQVLAFVSTPETRDLKDLASALITQSFVVMLVVIILQGGAMAFFDNALTPIYTTGQKLAQTIIQPNKVAKGETPITLTDAKELPKHAIKACSGDTGIYDPAKNEGALPKAMGDSIICTMTLIQNRTAQIKALGSASLCMSWKERWALIIPHLNFLLIGIGLWVSSMVMLLAVPFMMIDVVFELAVAAAMLPFGIGSYAFKVTRGYTKKIWETFLNSMFKFVFVSLVSLMLIVAFQSIITGSTGDLSYMFEGNAADAVMEDLLLKLPWFSTAFLKLIFVMILAWSVLGASLEFAGEFAGSISNTTIGSSIGTMAGSFTKSAATKILEPTAKATVRHVGNGIRAVAVAPIHLARRGANAYRANRIEKHGTRDADGNLSIETTRWFGGTKKLTLLQNADGTKSIRKDKIRNTKTGQVVKSKLMNDNFNIRTITSYDKNGNVVSCKDKVRFNSSLAHNMIRDDGTISHDFENMMLDRSVQGADKFNIALVKEAMAQRMPNTKTDMRNHSYVSQEALYEDGKFVGFVETHSDGSKTIARFRMSGEDQNGRRHLMTDLTQVDSKGRGTRLTSDGIINRKQTFVTEDGTTDGKINEDSVRSSYRLSEHYDKLFQNHGRGKVNDAIRYSMYSEEETRFAHRQIYAHDGGDRSIYEFKVYHRH